MASPEAMPFMDRVSNNIAMTFAELNPYKIIRLVIIVGAYALLRPYAMKLAGRRQERQFEQASAEDVLTANDLRGQLRIPDADEDDIDDILAQAQGKDGAAATGPAWGKKARKRQRQVLNNLLDQEEERLRQLQEDEEDKEIQEFLRE
ncbi:hypothetical protein Cpir12675_000429 [Ceratocystis pirilliformis]|uniref:Protein trafficking PGA2 n=1 Tax=Ceratocystis pirilliformis TaxID=259994 RepID=A0ABR3ZNA9_9PEZI